MNTSNQKLPTAPSLFRQVIEVFDLEYTVSSARLNLLVSIALAAFYNPMLWHYLFAQQHILNLESIHFVVSFVIIMVAIFYTGLSFISFRWLQKTGISVILMLAAAASYFMCHYGSVIDGKMMQHIANMGINDFANQLSFPFLIHMLLLGVFPCVLICLANITYQKKSNLTYKSMLGICAGLIILLGVILPQYHDFSGFIKQHKDLRFRVVPANVLYYSAGYLTKIISSIHNNHN